MSKGYNPNRDKDGKFAQGMSTPAVPDPSDIILNLPPFESSDTRRSAGEKIDYAYRVWRTSQDEEVMRWHKENSVPPTDEEIELQRIALLDGFAGVAGMWLSVSPKVTGAGLSDEQVTSLVDYLSGFRDEIEDSYTTASITPPVYERRGEPQGASSLARQSRAWLTSVLHDINSMWDPLLHEMNIHVYSMDFDTMWLLSDRVGRMYTRLEDAKNTVMR